MRLRNISCWRTSLSTVGRGGDLPFEIGRNVIILSHTRCTFSGIEDLERGRLLRRRTCHGKKWPTKNNNTRPPHNALTMKRSSKILCTKESQFRHRLLPKPAPTLKLCALRNRNWIMKVMRAATTTRKILKFFLSTQVYDKSMIATGALIVSSVEAWPSSRRKLGSASFFKIHKCLPGKYTVDMT